MLYSCRLRWQNIGGVVQLFSWPSQPRSRILSRHEIIEYNISSTIYIATTHLKIPGSSFISAPIAAIKTVVSGQDLIIGRYLRPCFFAALVWKVGNIRNPSTTLNNAMDRQANVDKSSPLQVLPWDYHHFCLTFKNSRNRNSSHRDNASPIIVAPDAANPISSQNRIDLNPDFHFHVAYIGSLHQGRGIDIIVGLARSISDCCFHIAGGTQAEVIKWQRITHDLPNIAFHGHLTTKDAEALRISCECLLAPYQLDTQVPGGMNTSRWMSPMKLFEYMAAGKAIICSDIPVLHEALTHEETAIMVSPGNLNEWVEAVSRLRDDEVLRKRLGRAAEKKHQMGGSWEDRCRNIFAAFGVDLHQGTVRKRRWSFAYGVSSCTDLPEFSKQDLQLFPFPHCKQPLLRCLCHSNKILWSHQSIIKDFVNRLKIPRQSNIGFPWSINIWPCFDYWYVRHCKGSAAQVASNSLKQTSPHPKALMTNLLLVIWRWNSTGLRRPPMMLVSLTFSLNFDSNSSRWKERLHANNLYQYREDVIGPRVTWRRSAQTNRKLPRPPNHCIHFKQNASL